MTDSSDDKKWYFNDNRGHRLGPSDLNGLKWYAERGYLLPASLVWTNGQPDWLPAEQVLPRDVFEDLPPPLPKPAQAPDKLAQARAEEQVERHPATGAADEKAWYFIDGTGARKGPSDLSDMRWFAAHGHLGPNSKVWTKGQTSWLPAERALPDSVLRSLGVSGTPADDASSSDQPETTPAGEGTEQEHLLLFKLLKNFDANLSGFPKMATRAGLQITSHRRPSTSTDIFEGVVTLGRVRAKVKVKFGINPVIGGIMRMSVTHRWPTTSTLNEVSLAAQEWFNRFWREEERVWTGRLLNFALSFALLLLVLAFLAGVVLIYRHNYR